jgi:hypothetical protein
MTQTGPRDYGAVMEARYWLTPIGYAVTTSDSAATYRCTTCGSTDCDHRMPTTKEPRP